MRNRTLKNPMKNFLNNLACRRGTSIVIALGLIAAITFFTIGIATTMISAIQNTASSKKALQAEYAAQGGVEMARKELKSLGVASGAGATGEAVVVKKICTEQDGNCKGGTVINDQSVYSTFTIKGKDSNLLTLYSDPTAFNYRSIPVLGTGNADENCAAIKNSSEVKLNSTHSCNWNKIYYGESVEIPLYVDNGDGTWKNYYDLFISTFKVRVRTPCENGSTLNCSPRYSVNVTSPGYGASGLPVINWQISGTCGDTGDVCGLSPVIATNPPEFSAIMESDLSPIAVLDFASKDGVDFFDPAKKGRITNFLKNLDPWAGNKLNKPVLKLSFVKEILDGNSSVPYLEYQILYRGISPFAASYVVDIKGIGYGFEYSLSGVSGLGAGLFDFAVQN